MSSTRCSLQCIRSITIDWIDFKTTDFIAIEDQEKATAGAIDLITSPSNQPFVFTYEDHGHHLPLYQIRVPSS